MKITTRRSFFFFEAQAVITVQDSGYKTAINISDQEIPYILIYLVKYNWASDNFIEIIAMTPVFWS